MEKKISYQMFCGTQNTIKVVYFLYVNCSETQYSFFNRDVLLLPLAKLLVEFKTKLIEWINRKT